MTHLEKMLTTFTAIGIEFTVRKYGEYEYVFVGERRDLYDLDGTFENGDLDTLLRRHKYFEFENGELASYSNS